MMRLCLAGMICICLLMGCGQGPGSSEQSHTAGRAMGGGGPANGTAGGPLEETGHAIYRCPRCGIWSFSPGNCPFDGHTLVRQGHDEDTQ